MNYTATIPDYIYTELFNSHEFSEKISKSSHLTYAQVFDMLIECNLYVEVIRNYDGKFEWCVAGKNTMLHSRDYSEPDKQEYKYWEEAACKGVLFALTVIASDNDKAGDVLMAFDEAEGDKPAPEETVYIKACDAPQQKKVSTYNAELDQEAIDNGWFFAGESLIITDPCYILKPGDWLKFLNDGNGNKLSYLDNYGIRGFCVPTQYGDWSCKTYILPDDKEPVDIQDKVKRGNPIKYAGWQEGGEFCADSGMVCVVNIEDAIKYNQDAVSKIIGTKLATCILDFTGRVWYFDANTPTESMPNLTTRHIMGAGAAFSFITDLK